MANGLNKRVDLSTLNPFQSQLPEEQQELNVDQVLFDPTQTFPDLDQSIYQGAVFDLFEKEYKESTGKNISLSKGNPFRTVIDLNDEKVKNELDYYKKTANDIASMNPTWNAKLSTSQKETFTDEWGKTMYGMVKYLEQNLPGANTKEGESMRQKFNSILDSAYENYLAPVINQDALTTAQINMTDSPGDLFERMGAVKDIAIGGAMKANPGLLARIGYVTELATPVKLFPNTLTEDIDQFADDIMAEGIERREVGEERLTQEGVQGTGRYGMTFDERFAQADGIFAKLDATLNPRYLTPAALENVYTQVGTTGLAVVGGAFGGSQAAGLGFIARNAIRLAGMAPGLTAGFLLEAGDAYTSSEEWMKELRNNAKQDRNRKSKEQFETQYSLNVGGTVKTADLLTDAEINAAAKQIGNQYATFATGIETLSSSLQAGNLARAASKIVRDNIKTRQGSRLFSRILTRKLYKTVLSPAGSVARTGVVTEAIEEGLQEFAQESILAGRLPQYQKNYSAIADAAYKGGATGLLLGGGSQLAKVTGNIIEKRRQAGSAQTALLDEKYDPKNDNKHDVAIIAGMGGLEPNATKIANLLNITKAQVRERAAKLQKQFDAVTKSDKSFNAFIKANKKSLDIYDVEQDFEASMFGTKNVPKKKRQDRLAINAAKKGAVVLEDDYQVGDYNVEPDFTDDYLINQDDSPQGLVEDFLINDIDMFEQEALKQRLQELKELPLTKLNMTAEQRDKNISSIEQQLKAAPKTNTKPVILDRSKKRSTSVVSKYLNKAKHLSKNAFNKKEKALVNKLKSKDLTPQELNKIKVLIDTRFKETKAKIAEEKGYAKGDIAFISSKIDDPQLAGKKVKVLSPNQNNAFVIVVGTKHKANVNYSILSKSKAEQKPAAKKIEKIPLSKRNVPELKKLASQLEIPGRSKLTTRKQLVDALEKYKKDRQQQPEQGKAKTDYDDRFFDEPNELVQLQQNDPNNPTDFRVTISGEKIELTPEQKEQLIKITKLMKSPVSIVKGSAEGSLFEFKRELLNKHRGFKRKVTGEKVSLTDRLTQTGDDPALALAINEEKELQKAIADEQAVDPPKIPVKKASKNAAKNIVSKSLLDRLVNVEHYSQEMLINMSDEDLQAHARNILVDPTNLDRDALIQEIINKQPPIDLQGGFFGFGPIRKSKRLRLHQLFRKSWFDILRATNLEGDIETFTGWVNEEIAPYLPEPFKGEFLDWANDYDPRTNKFSRTMNLIQTKLTNKAGKNSEFQSIEEVMDNSREALTENVLQQLNEGADVKAENINNLNSTFFYEMGANIDNDTMEQIIDNAKEMPFDNWIAEISKPEYNVVNQKGMTAFDMIARDEPGSRRLRQFWVNQRPENNIKINDGPRNLTKFETSQNKRVNISTVISRGIPGAPIIKRQKEGLKRLPSNDRPTMADRWIDYPIIMLNGKDIQVTRPVMDTDGQIKYNDDGDAIYRKVPKYGFFNAEELMLFTSKRLANRGTPMVPVFVRGDSDKLGLVEITEQDMKDAEDHLTYWTDEYETYKERNNGKENPKLIELFSSYAGDNKSDEQLAEIFSTPQKYRAANIARHKAYKALLTDDYVSLGAHKIMHRIKILMTPTVTFTGGKDHSMRMLNIEDAKDPKVKKPLYTVTTMMDGSKRRKDLIKEMDGKLQYVGDGETFVSERLLRETYHEELGTKKNAKRAKTVIAIKDDNGLLLVKHQEMAQPLQDTEQKIDLYYGEEKVAEFKRDSAGLVNIYAKNKNGEYNRYIDKLLTTDEAKVALGDYNNFKDIITLPSQATGHVQFTEQDKQTASFSMQIGNYMKTDDFATEVNKLIETNNSSKSAINLVDNLFKIADDPVKFDKFVTNLRSRNPDVMPRTVDEAARLGAGHHPGQLDYGKVLLKSYLLEEAMKLRQPGTVLDFRANFNSDIEKGKIVLPYNHNIRSIIAARLSQQFQELNKDAVMRLSPEDLNTLLKRSPVKVMVVRNPVPSLAGYKIYTIDKFATGMGDSFMINDEAVKETFEGDHDHDTGHISILPPSLEKVMEREQLDFPSMNLEQYNKNVNDTNLGSLEDTIDLMGELTDGKMAIGEIANVSRIAGMGQSIFNSMNIMGKTVKMHKLEKEITDPDIGEKHSIEQLFRMYSQASFDNVSLRLLRKWNYSQDKLYKMLFYNTDGTELSDIQYNVLKESFLKIMKKTQTIKNGRIDGSPMSLNDMLEEMEMYRMFVQDRQYHIYRELKNYKTRYRKEDDPFKGVNPVTLVFDVNMNDKIHPNEKLIMLPAERVLDNMKIEDVLNTDRETSKNAHIGAAQFLAEDNFAGDLTIKAFEKDSGSKNLSFDNLTEEELRVIRQDILYGEQWGKQMRSNLYETYKTIEETETGEKSGYTANSSTWDYNPDFIQYAEDWINGTESNPGYNQLTEVQKVASTLSFLQGVRDRDGRKIDVRKMPPHSENPNDTLLHPEVMKSYYKKYNELLKAKPEGTTDPTIQRLYDIITRKVGCE